MLNFRQEIKSLFNKELFNDSFCSKLYSSMTNVLWVKKGVRHTASFRDVSEFISLIRQTDPLHWYCSAKEGIVSPQIAKKLNDRGWTYIIL